MKKTLIYNVLDQNVLNQYIHYLKKIKYFPAIQRLKLIYNTEEECPYIYLELIKIYKSYRNQGYGSAVMEDIIRFANEHNVQVRLYASSLFGSDLKRLYKFYRRFGFVLIKWNKDSLFIHKPTKKLKNIVTYSEKFRIIA